MLALLVTLVSMYQPVKAATYESTGNLSLQNLQMVDQVIFPAYQRLDMSTQAFSKAIQNFCAQPTEAQLSDLRGHFKKSLAAWQSIQIIRFGPIENLLRLHRFQMWPDKRGKVAKHLRKVLSEKKVNNLELDKFVRGSTAIQGFGAAEMLLFNSKVTAALFSANDQANFRCQLLQTIGRNLQQMSAGLVYDWKSAKEPFRSFIATSENGNAFYESEREVGSIVLNNMVTELILIVDHKLARPLGKNLSKNYPKRAESWRSRESLSNISHNLNSIEQLYLVGFAPLLKDSELKSNIQQSWQDIHSTLAAIQMPIYSGVKDKATRQQLLRLQQQIADLKQIFATQLTQALQLPLGFNSLDGD